MRNSRRSRQPKEVQTQMRVAEGRWRVGDHGGAIQALEGILLVDAEFVPALELLVKARWQQGDAQAVVELMPRLLRLNPYEPGYHALLGAALQALGRLGDACQAFERAQGQPQAAESAARLVECQVILVRELLHEDRAFAVAYQQDAERALSSRGFYFPASPVVSPQALKGRSRSLQTPARPS